MGQAGLPSASELAAAIADDCNPPYQGRDRSDFLRVCQYHELTSEDPIEVREFIRKKFTQGGRRTGPIHQELAALPFRFVLTTNFDDLMERAFETTQGKKPHVAVYNDPQAEAVELLPEASPQAPVVFKLHGTLEKLATMICTEDDIIQFSARLMLGIPPLPEPIRNLFRGSSSSILFIGYSLRDWNIRVLMRAFRGDDFSRKWMRSLAIQKKPNQDPYEIFDWETGVMYWDQIERIQCIDDDALAFVRELGRRYSEKHGSAAP
jgi:hypothetical protein